MARPLRIEYEGALYHLMSRGNRRQAIFEDDKDRFTFLEFLAKNCARTGWQIHAYCLMSNHFHIVLETPQPNLVVGMKWLLGAYTQRFNWRHDLVGHLFAGRYKAVLIDGAADVRYLRTACDYTHLNPARAGMVGAEQPLEEYPWSSYPAYLRPPRKRPDWLRVDRLLGEHGVLRDDTPGRRRFRERMEVARREGLAGEELKSLRTGWRFGAPDFVERLGEWMEVKTDEGHGSQERAELDEQRALRILREELRKRGLKEQSLKKLRKGAPEKVEIALRIRQETVMTHKWIAARLHMGQWKSMANKLSKTRTEYGQMED